jgi:hypothetical protein
VIDGVAPGAIGWPSARHTGAGADGLARLLAGWTDLTADAVADRLRQSAGEAGEVAVLMLRVG